MGEPAPVRTVHAGRRRARFLARQRPAPLTMTTGDGVEQVVLLDEAGRAIGTADKATVHHRHTPLHLAFSCYVFDPAGRVLLTQRAWSKPTWPGVWTNSVCGHPGPGEPLEDAVRRRAHDELGLTLTGLRLALPAFRYRAVMDNGVVENEMCPVFVAETAGTPSTDPTEVAEVRWLDWEPFVADVLAGRQPISPWCADQVHQLLDLGPDRTAWRAAAGRLPLACRT